MTISVTGIYSEIISLILNLRRFHCSARDIDLVSYTLLAIFHKSDLVNIISDRVIEVHQIQDIISVMKRYEVSR